MGRVYTCVLLLVFSHTSLPLTDWTAIAKKTGESVVRIEASGATCTGFVINDEGPTVPSEAEALTSSPDRSSPSLSRLGPIVIHGSTGGKLDRILLLGDGDQATIAYGNRAGIGNTQRGRSGV